MSNSNDIFAPPSKEELAMFAAPSPEEIVANKPSLPQKVLSNIKSSAQALVPETQGALDLGGDILNSALDTARGVGQGLTFNATDELGGGLSAAAEALYNKFNPTNRELEAKGFKIEKPGLLDLYRQNQQAIQKELEGSAERSPWLYTGGQIAGGVTSGSAIGGALKGATAPKLLDIARNEGKLKALTELGIRGAKSYKEAAPIIAAESALSSKEGGLLTPEERSKLGEDVTGGLLFGFPAVFGLQTATDVGIPLAAETAGNVKSKLQGLVEDTPLLRQMKVAYGYGKQGINPKSQAEILNTELGDKLNLTQLDNQRTSKLMNEIYTAKNKIGQSVSDSLNNATELGKTVDIGQDTKEALQQIQTLAAKYPEIENNSRAGQIFGKIMQGGGDKVTPNEAKDLIDYMDAYIGKFEASTNTTPAEQGILSNLYSTRKQFSNTLKTAIPEYANAAERYNQFMKLVPETIIAGPRPVGVKGEFFGDLNNQDQKLFDQIKKLNQGTTRQGAAAQPVHESFVNTIKGLKTFEQQEAERAAAGTINDSAFARPASEIEKEIKLNSDDAVARGAMDALEPHTGVSTTLAKAVTGTGDTGRSVALSSANIAGRVTNRISKSGQNNPIASIARGIYNAPHETNLALSQKLKATPGLEKYGTALEEALNSPDSNRRNQVLFTIMQNPNARLFVNDENKDMTQENPSGSYTPQQ